MTTATRDVVVTGIGATTPLGGNVPDTWRAALAGESGISPLPGDWGERYELPVTFAAQLKVPAAEVLTKQQTRRMDPSAQYAMVAAGEAWADAGEPDADGERIAAVVASGIGGVWTLLDGWDVVRERGASRVLPLTVPMLMPNSPAANVSIAFGAKAGAHTPVSACASGAEAIAWGTKIIRDGEADVVIAGGTEAAIHPLPLAAFAKMQALSRRSDDPAHASRPYCTTRDGFVLGEGAAIVVLEAAEHAAARGARAYARVAGIGMSADAYDIAPPDPSGQGQVRAMRLALADAGLPVDEYCHVNAHATATPVGDTIEADAIRAVFGERTDVMPVAATKSMTGHLLGAAGALESIFTILALRERTAPPIISVEQQDPAVHLTLPLGAPMPLPEGSAALNNAFGFGGHNIALSFTTA